MPQPKGIKRIIAKKTIIKKPRKRSAKKITNVFNVGTHIRSKTNLNVSPAFVDEIIGRIKDQLDIDILEAEQIAKSMGMKTLMEEHAIKIYDFKIPSRYKIISCDGCGNSFVVDIEKASKKLICPFCGQKRYIKFL
jgi:ribosomal protein S27E